MLVASIFIGCASSEDEPSKTETRADTIARTSIIIDTHVDLPYRLDDVWEDVSSGTEFGNFDYPRAIAGGLNAPFMSIYTPSELEESGESRALAEHLIDMVEGIAEDAPDKFKIAYTTDDVRAHFRDGIISFPMGMENGSPIEGDLETLRHFYNRGIRYITLAHNLSNHICDSSRDEPKWDGLSPFGEDVVREMNRLGMMIDISHVSDDTFWDVMALSDAPAIASHSSPRHFTPGWPRNMGDDMIIELARKDGVIMINFGSSFLSQEANVYRYGQRDAYRAYLAENGLEASDEEEDSFQERWEAEYGPFPFADVEDVLDHFDHVVDIAGIDHVGIGSDYDGVGDTLPTGLKDVSTYPVLIEGLLRRGYTEQDIKKILGDNLLRVWESVEQIAASAS